MSQTRQAQCACSGVSYRVPQQPLFRMLCHCSICQRFNDAPMADMLVFREREVTLPDAAAVTFQTFRPPPNVQRGKCTSCTQPAIEVFRFPLLPAMVLVPAGMIDDVHSLPQPKCHVFYASRQQDVDDGLPRHSSYLSSQLMFFKHFFFSGVRG